MHPRIPVAHEAQIYIHHAVLQNRAGKISVFAATKKQNAIRTPAEHAGRKLILAGALAEERVH